MKIVLDSSVLIASFATRGLCHALFEHCITEHEVVLSEFIIAEVKEKLTEKFHFPSSLVSEIETTLRNNSKVSNPPLLTQSFCRDPDDDNILSLAKYADVDYLITGDKDLLELSNYESIPIITPKEFCLKLQIKKKT
ncbi:MAG: putative toxin-antitoxin system toxin component, PIN family [Candidatus Anammoxibacter sp.]